MRSNSQTDSTCRFSPYFPLTSYTLLATFTNTAVSCTVTSLDGEAVQMKEVETFAKSFDLPKFDVATLQTIKHLTFKTTTGLTTTFAVTMALKQAGERTATFLGQDAKVKIDATMAMATATIQGKVYMIDPLHQGKGDDDTIGRRLDTYAENRANHAKQEEARVYTEAEFFSAKHGFAKLTNGQHTRKLAADNTLGGFATLALPAGKAVLDLYNARTGENLKVVALKGTLIPVEAGPDGSNVPFKGTCCLLLNVLLYMCCC